MEPPLIFFRQFERQLCGVECCLIILNHGMNGRVGNTHKFLSPLGNPRLVFGMDSDQAGAGGKNPI